MPIINNNPEATAHAERILTIVQPQLSPAISDRQADIQKTIRAVLDAVSQDQTIQEAFQNAAIRYTAMCGEVAQRVLVLLGESPDHISLMSIGDVDLPPFARETADRIFDLSHSIHKKLNREEGYGYDLSSQGSMSARTAMITLFDQHYGFSDVPDLLKKLAKNTTITGGGMRALDDLATGVLKMARDAQKEHRFVHPDNSFGTWHSIADLRSQRGEASKVFKLSTEPRNLLHLTAEDVEQFYATQKNHGEVQDTWCITPVGNPSGTRMFPDQLLDTCAKIINHQPNATIILDCTYVRTLEAGIAKELLYDILQCPEILNQIVFVESFSKTHGLCGERLGSFFSANTDLFRGLHNVNMTLSAGNGRQKSAMVLAICELAAEVQPTIDQLHEFWRQERQGLYHYLMQPSFAHLFEQNQSHIDQQQLEEPLGLYLFLRLKPGMNGQQVLIDTKCMGVETTMGSGNYVRFAVGKIQKPTYAEYIPKA